MESHVVPACGTPCRRGRDSRCRGRHISLPQPTAPRALPFARAACPVACSSGSSSNLRCDLAHRAGTPGRSFACAVWGGRGVDGRRSALLPSCPRVAASAPSVRTCCTLVTHAVCVCGRRAAVGRDSGALVDHCVQELQYGNRVPVWNARFPPFSRIPRFFAEMSSLRN